VAIILEALNIPYTTTFVDFTAVKQEPYTAVNPNGRLPALTNLNANLTLWESGAIVQYLIDTYDAEKYSLSYESFPGRYLTQQWLHFQMSGQGPYYGQLGWFKRQNDPQTQALAIKRYSDEIHRVTSVLDGALADRQWLVGDKCTYADLLFVPWQHAGHADGRRSSQSAGG
jgi:glutathione S-transferase